MNLEQIKNKLKDIADKRGGKLSGVCRVDNLRETFHAEIKSASEELNTAISVGMPLSSAVMDTIKDHPNMIYKAHYQQMNHALNDIAHMISSEIEEAGYRSIPIPASQIVSWKPLRALLSHRMIAHKAGLGWWGRNNLLVNKQYGAQVRLVTILTDMDLPVDAPVSDDCEGCFECLHVCPADAIGDDREDFNLNACHEKMQEFSRNNNFGHLICGICLKACRGER
jgi:epoxyqueuosine reductase QueG